MTITGLLFCVVFVTFCSFVVWSFFSASAFARRRWTASITSGCCASTASPSFCVHSSCVLIMLRTCGVAASCLTLSSQGCLSTSALSFASLRFLFALAQRSACTTSSG